MRDSHPRQATLGSLGSWMGFLGYLLGSRRPSVMASNFNVLLSPPPYLMGRDTHVAYALLGQLHLTLTHIEWRSCLTPMPGFPQNGFMFNMPTSFSLASRKCIRSLSKVPYWRNWPSLGEAWMSSEIWLACFARVGAYPLHGHHARPFSGMAAGEAAAGLCRFNLVT